MYYHYKLQITELKHKPILQCKYTTPIQGYTGEYKYKTTSSRLPSWNINQYYSINTLHQYKAIL